MRQSNNAKSIVNADREAIRQALAILEEEGVDIIDDNTLDIPSTTTTTINNNTSIGDRLKKKKSQHHKQQNHALLSPSRSKATRRASISAFHSNSKHLELEESSSDITEATADLDSDNTLDIPYPKSTNNNNDTIGDRLKKKIQLQKFRHKQQNHALLSPSRSKATRRASVTAFHSNAKQLQLEESSRSNITEATADLDSCVSTTSYEESSSSSGTTSNSSSKKLDKHKKVDGKAKRKKNTKRSKSRQRQQRQSKKEEDKSSSSTGVRFSKHEQIEYIPHINDLSQTEIDSIWMKEDDYDTIRLRSLRLVEMIEDPKKRYPISNDTMIVNTHLICVRGLCDMTTHCVDERDAVQRQLQTAVFRLQSQQQERGNGQGATDHTQALRQVSRKYSKKSTKAARFVGISDRVTISI